MEERKLKSKIKKRIAAVLVLVIAVSFFWYAFDVCHEFFNLNLKEDAVISLEGGESIEEVIKILEDKDVIEHTFVFKTVSKLKRLNKGFGTGVYVLKPGMRYTEILRMMIHDYREVQLTFTEGSTKEEIFKTLSSSGIVSLKELEDAEKEEFSYDFLSGIERENYLEGYLFPETYRFSTSQTPKQMIEVFLSQFEKEFKEEYISRAREIGMSIDEVVILASVIEAETVGMENMKNVSSVFHKRLKNGDKMQSCATVQYLLDEKKIVLSVEDTMIDSPYNTYMYQGLPYGPVSNPSRDAILAALYPNENDYYYFQSDEDGNMYFAKTFSEHEQIRMKIQGEN